MFKLCVFSFTHLKSVQRVAKERTEHTSDWLTVICDRLCRVASLVYVVFMRGYEQMESGHI